MAKFLSFAAGVFFGALWTISNAHAGVSPVILTNPGVEAAPQSICYESAIEDDGPAVDLSSIKISKTMLQPGDFAEVSFRVDDQSGIVGDSGTLKVESISQQSRLSFVDGHLDSSGRYVIKIKLNEDEAAGRYRLSELVITNQACRTTLLDLTKLNIEFSFREDQNRTTLEPIVLKYQ